MTQEGALLHKIRQKEIPEHIAIIMDGNGRWAKHRGMPRIYGHRAGTKSVREMVRTCGELKVKVLTLYTFSTENWSRPKTEVNSLMGLLCAMLQKEVEDLNKNGVTLESIGKTEELPTRVQKELQCAKEKLQHNRGKGLLLNLALNYGGRQEILDATNSMIQAGIKHVDEKIFRDHLYTRSMVDPDLIIRTSGEERLSNFLIFQGAYSEFYVTKVFWPDFSKFELYRAIEAYQNRERRFGKA